MPCIEAGTSGTSELRHYNFMKNLSSKTLLSNVKAQTFEVSVQNERSCAENLSTDTFLSYLNTGGDHTHCELQWLVLGSEISVVSG
jgi:hypothetical protein